MGGERGNCMENISILVVEDEPMIAMGIERMLNEWGHTIAASVMTGEEAVEAVRNEIPDLILMDIVLAGPMDGIRAAALIRKITDVPILYLTGNADEITVAGARETQPAGYVLKPINKRDLYSNIDAALLRYNYEKRIQESEERYRTLIENVHDGIVVMQDQVIVYGNAQLQQIVGYPGGDMLQRPFLDFVHPEDRNLVMSIYHARLHGGSVEDMNNIRILHHDGNERWIELKDALIQWDRKPAVLIFLNDITERVNATGKLEQAVHERSQRVRELRFLYAIEKLFNEYDRSAKEVLQMIAEILPGAMQYSMDASAMIEFDGIEYASPGYSSTGWTIECNIVIASVRRGRIAVFYKMEYPEAGFGPFLYEEMDLLIELSLQLTRYLELRAMLDVQQRLSLIIESSDNAVFSGSMDGIIQTWNPGAERIYGYTTDEILGEHVHLTVPEMLHNEVDEILRELGKGAKVFRHETIRKRKDGTLFDALLSIAPLRDIHGTIIGFSGIVQDVSQRKELERQIVEIGIEERQKIGQTLHDRLGQMLTGVSLMARAVKQKFGSLHHEIPGIAGEMQTIINEAIELTRSLSRGLMPVDIVNSTLEDSLLELMELTERIYGVRCAVDVTMATDILDGFVSTQLYYIAQESVRNAVIHGKAGSVNISLKGKDNRFTLLVTDDGMGLQRPDMQGAGIGMKIMEYRARMIGAGVSYNSMEKGGCAVCCSFIG